MIDDYRVISTTLLGDKIKNPNYNKLNIREYQGNPLIEALPKIMSNEEVMKRLVNRPYFDEKEKKFENHIRRHCVCRIGEFFLPLDIHLRIEKKISALIRQGYYLRNPIDQCFVRRLQELNDINGKSIEESQKKMNEISIKYKSHSDSLAIIGVSGMGKTSMIERILLLYPQLIRHSEYKNEFLHVTQIVWLKIDSPHDGSLKTLCKYFFKAIDDVLGNTEYYNKDGNNRNSASTMMLRMTYLASLHSIGLLVIDETQHLISGRQSPDEVLNFFVTLANTVGIPTVLIGTPKSKRILGRNFRQTRRSSSMGIVEWDRMEKDEMWKMFLEELWKYSWLREESKLTDEMINLIYDLTQGITSVLIVLYQLAQERALEYEVEKIDCELLNEVARDDLGMLSKMIDAVRTKDIFNMLKYDDLILDINQYVVSDLEVTELRKELFGVEKKNKKVAVKEAHKIREYIFQSINEREMFGNLTKKEIYRVISKEMKNGYVSKDIEELSNKIIKILSDKSLSKNDNKSKNTQKKDKTLVDIIDEKEKQKDMYTEVRSEHIKSPNDDFGKY